MIGLHFLFFLLVDLAFFGVGLFLLYGCFNKWKSLLEPSDDQLGYWLKVIKRIYGSKGLLYLFNFVGGVFVVVSLFMLVYFTRLWHISVTPHE